LFKKFQDLNDRAKEIFLYQRLAIKEILILPEAKLRADCRRCR